MEYLLRGKNGCIVGLPEYFEQINLIIMWEDCLELNME